MATTSYGKGWFQSGGGDESAGGGMVLEEGLQALQAAVDLMSNNKYHEAVRLLKPKAETSMYHSMAYGTVMFLQAVFSVEREVIDNAVEVLNKTVELCNSSRRQRGVMESISGWVFGQRLDSHTPTELQAEVFYAEANLLLSFLTFLGDENLMSFVKGGLRIRSCYSSYKQLFSWLETCDREGTEMERNFTAGVRMGFGCFNLYLSLLPTRVLRLLEFVGFSVSREVGLDQLGKGVASETFRAPLCSSFLLFYHTVAAVFSGIELEADRAEELLKPQLEKYPNSVQFLYFKGRVAAMRGDTHKAVEAFQAAIDAQDQWRQVCHLCWWELAWCHSLRSEWGMAAKYCHKLYKESRWSKASFLYMKASFLLMQNAYLPPEKVAVEPANHDEITEMMKKVPPLKQRIAGRSLPIEKFSVSKSERYVGGGRLPLSGMELLYSHNAFLLLKDNPALLRQLLEQVTTTLRDLEKDKDTDPWYTEDWTVATFVKGCILRLLESEEAEKCFLDVIDRASVLRHDHYTVPAAMAELGLLYIATGRLEEAQRILEAARTNYKGYHLESRIHFRIHAGLNRIQTHQHS